jgi:hypothetical protein
MVTVSPVDPELARVGSAAGSTLAKGLKLYFEIEGENAGKEAGRCRSLEKIAQHWRNARSKEHSLNMFTMMMMMVMMVMVMVMVVMMMMMIMLMM